MAHELTESAIETGLFCETITLYRNALTIVLCTISSGNFSSHIFESLSAKDEWNTIKPGGFILKSPKRGSARTAILDYEEACSRRD